MKEDPSIQFVVLTDFGHRYEYVHILSIDLTAFQTGKLQTSGIHCLFFTMQMLLYVTVLFFSLLNNEILKDCPLNFLYSEKYFQYLTCLSVAASKHLYHQSVCTSVHTEISLYGCNSDEVNEGPIGPDQLKFQSVAWKLFQSSHKTSKRKILTCKCF